MRSPTRGTSTCDGTIDATTANASHTYTTPGKHTATFRVSDGTRSRPSSSRSTRDGAGRSCPGDDEFEGTALDRSRWQTVVREDDAFMNVRTAR